MPPPLTITIQYTNTMDGPPQIQIQTNADSEPGVWRVISSVLMDAMRIAIETDVREQQHRDDHVIQVPTILFPGGLT